MKTKFAALGLISILGLTLTGCASRQDLEEVRADVQVLLDLESRVAEMEETVGTSTFGLGGLEGDIRTLDDRVDALESTVAGLQARIAEVETLLDPGFVCAGEVAVWKQFGDGFDCLVG